MNHIRTIIIDDEPRGITSLQKLLEINCPHAEVVATSSNPAEAINVLQQQKPQLVFLDIAMPGTSGIELLKQIQPVTFEVIFVTAHNHFMTQAFQLSAVDYLLKPVDDNLLTDAVNRASKRIAEKNNHARLDVLLHNMNEKGKTQKMKLCIPSMKGFRVIEIADIIYCEATSNYTNFYFADNPLICASKPIHEYESLLEDCNFVRIHKSYLVNLEHIQEYIRGEGGSIIVSNGKEIDVSRRKKELLIEQMKKFYKF
jgi:two-component system, LytTR family, response regulator